MPRAKHKAQSRDLPWIISFPLHMVLLVVVIAIASSLVAVTFLPAFAGINLVTKKIQGKMTELESTFHRIRFPQTSAMYAADGSVLTTISGGENRTLVNLKKVAPIAQDAVLAIEDHDFYKHGALDALSILRAAITNLAAGEVRQGGSTITQQLVKNAEIGSTAQTFQRKFQEAALAARMEREYTKPEILELYLNEIYLANGQYGIGTAAQYYFNRPASKLNLTQSALLAGMIQSPENYDPTRKKTRKAALARRNVVLEEMASYGYITAQQAAKATKQPITLHVTRSSRAPIPFYAHHVLYNLLNLRNHEWDGILGTTSKQRLNTLGTGGFKIYTAYEPKMEQMAQNAADRQLGASGPDTGIASIVPGDGAVPMMLSGKNYDRDQYDLAAPELTDNGQLLGVRQPGSSFKPYTLVTAFKQGISPQTTFSTSSPWRSPLWDNACHCVYNAEGAGIGGFVNLYTATADSINVVFAQLILQTGAQPVVDTAYDMGIRVSPLTAVDSITLGSVPISPLEQATGFATLAAEGLYCAPYFVTKIVGPKGVVLYKHKPQCKQVIDADIANLTTQLLEGVVTGGTGTAAAIGRPVAGKTGTSQDSADLWFAGYTPQLSTAVWVGYPKGRVAMPGHYGGTDAAPIWHDYMLQALRGEPTENFPLAGHVKFEPTKDKVPNVVGMTLTEATKALQQALFQVSASTIDSDAPKDEVVSQTPAAGATAASGSTVRIEVSSGKPPLARVPKVEGMILYSAQRALQSAGFGVSIHYQDVTEKFQNRLVLDQSPRSGSEAKSGTTVSITVGRYVAPAPIPSP